VIEFKKVSKSYDGVTYVIDRLDLTVSEGEFLVLLGESGCGKTTTLKMINRLIERTKGELLVGGQDVQTLDVICLRRSIGYVFQKVGLFPHMTIDENIGVVPNLLGWEHRKILARCDELMKLVGLDPKEFSKRYPQELSGGQQQRVGFARALAAGPKIILLDEPFGALDPITRFSLQKELRSIHRKLGLTTVMVTHDVTEALLMADKIAIMADGNILQMATPKELVQHPINSYIDSLLQTPKIQADEVEEIYEG